MTGTHLVVGAEVIDAVGADKAAVFQDQITIFDCVECGTAGDVRRELAVAVLRTDGGLAHLGVAHHRCTPSRVHQFAPGALRGPAVTDLTPRAVGVPGPQGTRPVLLLAYEEDLTLLSDPGTDLVVQFLLSQGLHRLSSLGRQPPASPGWQVRLSPGDGLEARTPQQTLLRDGQMSAPRVWRDLVAHAGEVTVLVGRLDRAAIYAAAPPFGTYQAAVRSGRLVGGHLSVTASHGA